MVNYNAVTFTVSGKQFHADRRDILKHPSTAIAKLLQRYPQQSSFGPFNGSPERFQIIMDWYRNGKFYIPKGLTRQEMVAEAKRYSIPFEKSPSNDHDFMPALLRVKLEASAQNLASMILEKVLDEVNGQCDEGYTDPAHRASIQLADGKHCNVVPNALFFFPERECTCCRHNGDESSDEEERAMTPRSCESANVREHEPGCPHGDTLFKLLAHFATTQNRKLIDRATAILAPNNLQVEAVEQPFGDGGQLSIEYSFLRTEECCPFDEEDGKSSCSSEDQCMTWAYSE